MDTKINRLLEDSFLVLGENVVIGENVILCEPEANGFNDTIFVGNNCILRSGCVIYSGCKLGNGVKIGHNSVLLPNTIIGDETYIGSLVCCEGNTTIGEHCGIVAQSHLTRFMTIEDYVFFGTLVCTTNDYRMTFKREGHGKNLKGPTIRRGARIGSSAVLLAGVEIGENSIIGANAVVIRDVPKHEVWFGNPAKKHGNVDKKDFL